MCKQLVCARGHALVECTRVLHPWSRRPAGPVWLHSQCGWCECSSQQLASAAGGETGADASAGTEGCQRQGGQCGHKEAVQVNTGGEQAKDVTGATTLKQEALVLSVFVRPLCMSQRVFSSDCGTTPSTQMRCSCILRMRTQSPRPSNMRPRHHKRMPQWKSSEPRQSSILGAQHPSNAPISAPVCIPPKWQCSLQQSRRAWQLVKGWPVSAQDLQKAAGPARLGSASQTSAGAQLTNSAPGAVAVSVSRTAALTRAWPAAGAARHST